MSYKLDYSGAEVNRAVGQAKDMVDYIVASGTSGFWTWRRWASGISECWGTTEVNLGNPWEVVSGTLYGYESASAISFPSGLFIESPSASVTLSQYVTGWAGSRIDGLNGIFPRFYTSYDTQETGRFSLIVNGRWK